MKKAFVIILVMFAAILCAWRGTLSANADEVTCIGFSEEAVMADGEESVSYSSGVQIDLYLDSDENVYLSDRGVRTDYVECRIADESVARIKDSAIVAISEGVTYLSCVYEDGVVNHNVIVHGGDGKTEGKLYVGGKELNNVELYAGKTYALSFDPDEQMFSHVSFSVEVLTKNGDNGLVVSDTDPFEIVVLDKNGNMTVAGVGAFRLTVSRREETQTDVEIYELTTSFEDENMLRSAERYFEESGNATLLGDGSYLRSDLEKVTTYINNDLRATDLDAVAEIFPSFDTVLFDLSDAEETFDGKTIVLKKGVKYGICGKGDEVVFGFSVIAEKCETFDLFLKDLYLCDNETILDMSAATNVVLRLYGECELCVLGAVVESGKPAVSADKIEIHVASGAVASFCGGDGNVGEEGGSGLYAEEVSVFGENGDAECRLTLRGGTGGAGTLSVNDGIGIKGAAAVEVKVLNADEYVDLVLCGGNGGNGAQGAQGRQGTAGNSGGNGGVGGNGGSGGDGAEGLTTLDVKRLTVYGGNGGIGGNGGDGGKGANGIAESRNSTPGGSGGSGGNGGNGGSAGFDTAWLDGTDAVVYGGNGGAGGRGGNGGDGGAGATLSVNQWVISWVNDYGYRGGNGGNAGNGGNGGSPGASYNVSGHNVAAAGGERGAVGSGGTGGWRRAIAFTGGWASPDYFPAGSTPTNTAKAGESGSLDSVESSFSMS